ncbi:MAG TPA: hydroxymethylbilane synthase [Egibacteraceae bacterium]|nr:hydroxymethylbilane synthase [Egibacteraceae bacterium]
MLRIATRRSPLARAQAFQTGQLISARTGEPFELVAMAATGDLDPDRVVEAFESKGLFVDTIRQAVADGDCDLAVHSYKDLPTDPHPGLVIGAVPPREDPRDVLISRDGHALATLPPAATVGTSSARRRLQLLRAKPSLEVVALRGNLGTRLRAVAERRLDAAVVAAAGLRRLYTATEDGGAGPLGLAVTGAPLEPGECLPAPAQGALAIERRADDPRAEAVCAAIDDRVSHVQVRAERAFLAAVGGGCLAPVGALCHAVPGGLELLGMIADPVERRVLRVSLVGAADDPEALGAALAEAALAEGGDAMVRVIEQLRASTGSAGA